MVTVAKTMIATSHFRCTHRLSVSARLSVTICVNLTVGGSQSLVETLKIPSFQLALSLSPLSMDRRTFAVRDLA